MLPKIATSKYDMIVPSTGTQVTYRPYLIKEEKVLMIALESKSETQIEGAILHIIDSCVEGGTKKLNLTLFDVEYMFLMLRSKSVGEGVKLTPHCESCEETTEVTINLESCEVKNKSDKAEHQVKLSDELTVDVHFPRVGDSGEGKTESDKIISTVSRCIETIYYGEEVYNTADSSKAELIEFVENLNNTQFQKIADILLAAPYVGHDINFKCSHCGHENVKELKGLIDFFM